MAHLVEVAFKGNRKEFFIWQGETAPPVRTPVIVEADRGEDLGRVNAIGDLAGLRARGCTHGIGKEEPSQKAIRVASPDDLRRLDDVRAQDESARREAMTLVKTHALDMKLTDAEWRWDRRKLTMYFSAERRVDFRALVRDLAGKFRTRIELKQIGVRDEAKRLDGVGRCGRQYCSASWLPELRPVNLGLAKDQKLSLNPTQISGACGRLMCCLRYEHDWYVETRRLFPKEGKVVVTALGEEKVVLNDLFRQRVSLRKIADGEARVISLAQLNKELRGEPVETDEERDTGPVEDLSDELLAMTDTVERPIPRMMPPPSERPVKIERAPAREESPAPRPRQQSPRGERPPQGQRQQRPRNQQPPRPQAPRDTDKGQRVEGARPPEQQPSAQSSAQPGTQPGTQPGAQSGAQPGAQPRGDRPRSRRRRGRRGGHRGGQGGPDGQGGPPGAQPGGPSGPAAPGPAE